MELSVYDQLRQITAALITGGFIGIVFDIAGGLLRRRNAVRGIAFFITGILSAGIIFAVGRRSGAGLRLFFLLAVSGGLCLYWGTFHPMVREDLTVIQHYLQYYAQSAHRSADSRKKK